MSMNKEKAMKILGLNYGFTTDNLKKAYRIRTLKYHTDNLETGNNEMMQEINEAYSYLKDYVSNFSSYNQRDSYTNFDVDAYKREKLKELERRVKFSFEKYENIPFSIRNRILLFQEYVKGCLKFGKESRTKSEVDEEFTSEILPELYLGLKNIECIFYQEYAIDKDNVKILLNYDDDLESFYDSLIKIKNKYSGEAVFEQKIDKKIAEYKDMSGYNRLAKFIEKIKIKCIHRRTEFETDDSCIKYFNDMVLNIFSVMYDYETQISKIEEVCYNINDDEIKHKLDSLLMEFNCIENFGYINRELIQLQGLIKTYEEEQERLKIPSYYGMILNRYTSSLQQLNGIGYLEEANIVSNIFQKCLEFMQDVERRKRNIADLDILSRITFSNYKQDLKLLEINVDQPFSDIYIINKNVADNDYDTLLIGKVINKSVKIVEMIGYNLATELSLKRFSIDLFRYSYISLEDFLEKENFWGYESRGNDAFEKNYLLYSNNYINIYYFKDPYFYFNTSGLFLNDYVFSNDFEIRSFENKELIKLKISKYFDSEIKEWQDNKEKKYYK